VVQRRERHGEIRDIVLDRGKSSVRLDKHDAIQHFGKPLSDNLAAHVHPTPEVDGIDPLGAHLQQSHAVLPYSAADIQRHTGGLHVAKRLPVLFENCDDVVNRKRL
jgi:hypothetical protein